MATILVAERKCAIKNLAAGSLRPAGHARMQAFAGEEAFALGPLYIDFAAHRVRRAGVPVELTPQEYSLLEALITNRNRALSRKKLLALAWGYSYAGQTRTVDVHIQRLRKKLGLENEIQTIFKVGYRLSTG